MLTSVTDIDWEEWDPQQRATLLFVFNDDQVLLIRKKRGLGAGKINGPGGRIEPGETARDAAIREVTEEVCITPTGVEYCGELSFQFIDGLSLHCTVFRANAWQGRPRETDEALPLWFPVSELPYDDMWADDRHWMPHMLAGRAFNGRFIFDADRMVDYGLDVEK